MKYTADNKPLYCPQTNSMWYKYAGTVKPCGVLWHSTGVDNPYIKRYVQPSDGAHDYYYWTRLIGLNKARNDWNHQQVEKGVHAFIGKIADNTISSIQCGPWDKKAWGCGSGSKGSCNNGWIQFEMCEDGLTNRDYFIAVYKEAVDLTAYLCVLYNFDPHGKVWYKGKHVPVILDHYESSLYGLGSAHADVRTWLSKFGYTMDRVRNDVAERMGEDDMTGEEIYHKMIEYLNSLPTSDYAKNASKKGIASGIFSDGDKDGLVDNPRAPITRQDLALLFDRLGLLNK